MTIPSPWLPCLQTAGVLALEVGLIVGLAAGIQGQTRSALRHRTLWQAAVLGLMLLTFLEISGLSNALAAAARAWAFPTGNAQIATASLKSSLPAKHSLQPDGAPITAEFKERVAIQLSRNHRSIGNAEARVVAHPPAIVSLPAPALSRENEPSVEPYLQEASLPWLELVWVIGTAAILGLMGLARLIFRLFHRQGSTDSDKALLARVGALSSRLGLSRQIRVFESSRLNAPIAFGLVRPTIGLPAGFTKVYSFPQQEVMLAHELAHLAAHDPAWLALADLVAALLWWHPLAWWARNRLRSVAETAADEASLLVTDGPGLLAECLLDVASRLERPQSFGWVGMAGSGIRSQLGRRIQRLVQLQQRPWTPLTQFETWTVKIVGPLGLTALAVLCTAWVDPQPSLKGENMQSITHTWKRSVATLALFATLGTEHADSQINHAGNTPPAEASPAKPSEKANDSTQPGAGQISALTLVQDAKLLQGMGKLDEAEAKLKEALTIEPQNKKGVRALAALRQAQSASSALPSPDGNPGDLPPAAGVTVDHAGAPGYRMDPRMARRYGLLPQANKPAATTPPTQLAAAAAPTALEEENANPAPLRMDPALAARYGLKVQASPVHPSRGKQQIEAKLNQIVLSEVVYDGLPLSEIVKDLNDTARKRDTEKRGINFLISNVPENPAPSGIDPATGQPLPAPSVVDLNNVPVRLHLRDIRLKDVLDAMSKVSESPIEYSVEDYGVVFSPGGGPTFTLGLQSIRPIESLPLQVRTFKVDTNTFLAGLESAFGIVISAEDKIKEAIDTATPSVNRAGNKPSQATQQALRQLLQQLGINMEMLNKAIFYNGLTGIVMVRAAGDDLDLVQAAIETLGGKALRPGLTGDLPRSSVSPSGRVNSLTLQPADN